MRLVKSFATVGGATIASRLLGFIREILIASIIGAGPIADAFYAAFRFPNLFRRLFAEGAFNAAFIPLFAKELEAGGRETAQNFAQQVFSVLLVCLLILTALAELSMPVLVSTIIAPRFGEGTDKTLLTIELARIMFPYLLCMSLVALLSGVLNSYRRYFAAAFVPVLLNIILILVLIAASALETGDTVLTAQLMAWGVFTAGFAQLGLVWLAAKKIGFRLRLTHPRLTPAIKRVLILALPTAVAGGITQINLLIGQIIASGQEGAIALLHYADRIYQLPFGVIGIAIGVVLLPELSRELRAGTRMGAEAIQNQSLEFAMLLTLPAAIALFIMPEIITSTLYERGAFDAEATQGTANALTAFALGLPAFVLIKVFTPVFFARENSKTPMIYASINAITNIALSISFFPTFGHVGIALATSLAAWLNVFLLYGHLYWQMSWPIEKRTLNRLCIMLVASCGMGTVLMTLQWAGYHFDLYETTLNQAILMILFILIGMIVYFGLCWLTGAVKFRQILQNLKR